MNVTRLLLLAGCLACGDSACAGDSAEGLQPDILLIMPDQMRGDCLSILGHPAVRTPQFDRLARHGALFRRAYATVPSCIPARFALLSGLHPQTSGVVGYAGRPFPAPPLPELLAGGGYVTALVGRNMHQLEQNGDCGYQQQVLGSTYVAGDEYDGFLRAAAPACGGIRELFKDLGLTANGWQASPWPLAEELHPNCWIVERAREVVAKTPAARALFLTASFYAPHPPLFPPERIFEASRKRELPQPAHGEWVDWKALSPEGTRNGHRVLLQGEALSAAQAGYFGLIEHLDEQLAALIAAFQQRSEQAGRPWVIVFTSDHGEMLGDHGYYRKCEPYEGSANIPFVIAASAELGFKAGVRSLRPVCLEDLLPTLLELAGLECPHPVDGISLVPSLRGEEQAVREWLHFEHAPCYGEDQAFHALCDGRYKYIWRPTSGAEQLFDLETDPLEERDLTGLAAHGATLKTWRTRLVERLAARPEGFSDGVRLIAGRPYRALVRSGDR